MKNYNRPLSPHLLIYKPQITSIISIFHRITGSLLALIFLSTSTFLVLISCFSSFYLFHFSLEVCSLLYLLILYFVLMCMCFHLLNGIRHISWDLGLGLDLNNLTTTGLLVLSLVSLFLLVSIIL